MTSDSFVCINCNKTVPLKAPGTHNRNHCPYCLHSKHVDIEPGDRKSPCLGNMDVIAKYLKNDGEEVLVHKCGKCGFIRYNRIAGDDDFDLVESLKIIPIDELGNL